MGFNSLRGGVSRYPILRLGDTNQIGAIFEGVKMNLDPII